MPARRTSTYTCAIALGLTVLVEPAATRGPVSQQQGFSSFALINRALEAGAIDAETADRYRMFAAFSDTRLPAAYRGDDRNMSGLPPEVAGVGERMRTYSAATQAELAPFFARPADDGSWITLSTVPGQDPVGADGEERDFGFGGDPATSAPGGPAADERAPYEGAPHEAAAPGPTRVKPAVVTWQTVSAVGGKAKVWWQDRYTGDDAIARGLANELTSVIWPRLTGLMAQEPVTDAGFVNNGGDGALDVYLVHAPTGPTATWGSPWLGVAMPAAASAPCHPARYLLIDTGSIPLGDANTYGVIQVATHELMHAVTFAYRVRTGCPVLWVGEASGDWASNWLYPLTDGEHPDGNKFMLDIEYQIDNAMTPGGTARDYGGHIFHLFLQEATGGTGFMPRMWTNFKTMDVLEGIDAAIPGGFEKSWPRFLNSLWNRPPVDAPDGFKQWDRYPIGTRPAGGQKVVRVTSMIQKDTITFIQADPARAVIAPGVQAIAGHYRDFVFDPSVRAVMFFNTIREEALTQGTVWAIEKIHGTWRQPLELTQEWQRFWCRDNPQEDLEELVLIFGNIDWKTRQPANPRQPPKIESHPIGCSDWTGTTSKTVVTDVPEQGITIREHVTSTIRFELDPLLVEPGLPPEHWKSVGGILSWDITVSGRCSGGKSGGTSIIPDPVEHFATMSLWRDDSGRMHHSAAGHWLDADPRYPVSCPEGPAELLSPTIGTFFTSDVVGDTLATDGKSFVGQYTERPAPGMTITTMYSFRCRGC